MDGTEAVVSAHSFRIGKKRRGKTDDRAMRYFSVSQRVGPVEFINEVRLENRIGQEQFRRLIESREE